MRLMSTRVVIALAVGGIGAAPVPEDPAKAELKKLDGLWEVVSCTRAGVEFGVENKSMLTFKDGAFTWGEGDEPDGKILTISPSKTPKEADYTYHAGALKDKTQKAIYQLDGDTFMDCFEGQNADGDRPKEFKSTKENGLTLVKYKRVKESRR